MNNKDEFLQQLRDAEMVLIGIGEEFNNSKVLKQIPEYIDCKQKLEASPQAWMIPALNMMYEDENKAVQDALANFAELIADKNYFVVSVSTNEAIRNVSWREKRLVMPCGGSKMKQCANGCGHSLTEVTEEDWKVLTDYKDFILREGLKEEQSEANENNVPSLGVCENCGGPLVLNSIYTEKYDENGYLDQWQLYTKWLQGSLNRKLMVVELGVGMQCPSVIRWPFEKVAFFNQKATFWRINENLYQLSEELKGKGTAISMNAIDWLRFLC